MFEDVDKRKAAIDSHRPCGLDSVERLRRVFDPLFIYNSNALEGNTLTFGETVEVLGGRTPSASKRVEEIREVDGQRDALAYLQRVLAQRVPFSEKLIRDIHQLLTRHLDPTKFGPGQYKTRDNRPERRSDRAVFPYVSHVDTPAQMQQLVEWFATTGGLHPVQRAAELHYRFILIHPFLDGNGRTARLLMALVLEEANYGPVIIRTEERIQYLDALEAVDSSVPLAELAPFHPGLNLVPFVSFVERSVLWSQDRALDVLEGRIALTPDDLVRQFERIEDRAARRGGLDVSELERDERLAARTREVASQVSATMTHLTAPLRASARRLRPLGLLSDGPESKVLWQFGHQREVFGEPVSGANRYCAIWRLQLERSDGAPPEVKVPWNAFEVVIRAEPHRIVLVSVSAAGSAAPYVREVERDYLPIEPSSVFPESLVRALTERLGRFLANVESLMS